MGKTTGTICLGIGIINLIFGFLRPGLFILAIIALIAAYLNLAGGTHSESIGLRTATFEETEVCPICGTKNLPIAKVCRGCAKPFPKEDIES